MKKNNFPTVSIGIPAYNEEANIGSLLQDLITQKQVHYRLISIVVASDNSSDKTVNIAKSFRNPLIKIIAGNRRRGQAYRQNQIISLTNANVLVLLNADIRLKNKFLLNSLVKPILKGDTDLSSCRIIPTVSKILFSRILRMSTLIKEYISNGINEGDNLFNCHGRVRAFSKRLYKMIVFDKSIHEDAYSYLYTKANNFKFKFVKSAFVYYKLPTNFEDHFMQSNRFIKKREILEKNFGQTQVKNAYKIPLLLGIYSFLRVFIKHPIYTTLYVLIIIAVRVKSIYFSPSNLWIISKSSKFFYE